MNSGSVSVNTRRRTRRVRPERFSPISGGTDWTEPQDSRTVLMKKQIQPKTPLYVAFWRFMWEKTKTQEKQI